jgi:hypothetical protein
VAIDLDEFRPDTATIPNRVTFLSHKPRKAQQNSPERANSPDFLLSKKKFRIAAAFSLKKILESELRRKQRNSSEGEG